MYIALPLLGQRFYCGKSQSHRSRLRDKHNWKHLEKVGLTIDIIFVIAAIITATAALVAYVNPFGPLNSISTVSFPTLVTLYAGSAIIIIIDLAKCCCKPKLARKPLKKGDGAAALEIPSVSTETDDKSDSSSGIESENSVSYSESAVGNLDGGNENEIDGGGDDDDDGSYEGIKPANIHNYRRQYVELQYNGSSSDLNASTMLKSAVVVSHASQQLDGSWVLTDSFHPDNNASNGFSPQKALAQGLEWVGQKWAELFAPGTIQKRLYFFQVSFIIEQLLFLSYNEQARKKVAFDNFLLPVPFIEKYLLLEQTHFLDPIIESFRKSVISILQNNQSDFFKIRMAIFELIEKEGAKLLKQAKKTRPLAIQQLCYALYTQFNGISYGFDLIALLDQIKPTIAANLAEAIKQDQETIEGVGPEIKGTALDTNVQEVKGIIDKDFKPMLENNFASALFYKFFKLPGGGRHTVTTIRYGTPTHQDWSEAEILVQNELFILECKRLGKTIMSYQHQTWKEGGGRLKTNFDLAVKYPRTYRAMHLDMDSSFYQQSSTKQLSYSEFEQKLLAHHTDFVSYDRKTIDEVVKNSKKVVVSPNLYGIIENLSDVERDLRAIAREIRQETFPDLGDNDLMTVDEKKDFIFLFKSRFINYIDEKTLPDFSSSQCKDTRDRSMTIQATAYLINQRALGEEKTPETAMTFRALTSFVSMNVKGGPVAPVRFERQYSAVSRYVSKIPPQKKKEEPKVGLYKQSIPERRYDYTYAPLPCDIEAKDYQSSPWVVATDGDARVLLPLTGRETKPQELLKKFYQNNGANIGVTVNDQDRFTVYQGTEDNSILSGTFETRQKQLSILVN